MSKPKARRQLAAIVVADVVGYSRLMGADEEGTLAALRSHRTALIDPLVKKHEGHLVKTTGDGLLLEFPSVVQAVAWAVAVQRGMADRNAETGSDERIQFRIGINLGDVIIENDDVFGDGVNIAARLEQLANPGEVWISDAVYRQVESKVDAKIVNLGRKRLKNIKQPVQVYKIVSLQPPAANRRAILRTIKNRRVAAAILCIAMLAIGAVVIFSPQFAELLSPVNQRDAATRMDAASTLPVIAVLPFANQTGDEERDYIAAGFTEELIGALGRFNTVRVIGHSAVVSSYRGRTTPPGEIASALGAAYLVEGGVRGDTDRLRISARLTDARQSTVLWSDQFDGAGSDLLGIQDAIARHISGSLAASITQIEGQRSLDRPKPELHAHDLVLQARALGYGGSRDKNRKFRNLLKKAIDIDPDYAAAHALLAEAIYARIAVGWTEFAASEAEKGERYARQAIGLAPNEPDGYRALGRFHLLRAEYEQARQELKRAIELNPSDSTALAMSGAVEMYSGEIAGAIDMLELALKYNPALEPFYLFDLSLCYYLARRFAEALRTSEQGISQFRNFPNFHISAAAAAAQLGRAESAARHVRGIRKRLPFFNLDALGTRFRDPTHPAFLKDGLQKAGL